jgi:hypothetical protein
MVAASSEAATARPTVLGNFMGAPLLPARRTMTRRNGFNHCFNRCGGDRVCFGRPSRPKDRAQPAKLEILFGHAFDRRRVSLSKSAVRVRTVGLRSAIEGRAVLGPSGVGRLEGALRDHHFPIASQRFENAMRQPRSVPRPDRSCCASVWSKATRLLVGDYEPAVAEGHFKPAHCWIIALAQASVGAAARDRSEVRWTHLQP